MNNLDDREENPTLLIDASIYIFQYYFAMPDNWFSEKESWPTAAVYGYTCFLLRLLKEQKPERIAACFDESLSHCFRNKIYPSYKCSRALPDEALAFQLNACKKVTKLLGISVFSSKKFEADDLLGSLYHRSCRSIKPIAVLTRDKDLGQLIVRDQDFIWDYSASPDTQLEKGDEHYRSNGKPTKDKVAINKPSKGIKYFFQDIIQKLGVRPQQIADYLALVGDAADDIPGVPGVGKKTAQQLLANFNSVEEMFFNSNLLSALPIRGAKSLSNKLLEYKEQILMAKQLATIVIDIPLIDSVDDLSIKKAEIKKYELFCNKMGFPRLINAINFL